MSNVVLTPIHHNIIARYTNENAELPSSIQNEIESYWRSELASGKNYTRGDVFTITQITDKKDRTELQVDLTDYAHYLATVRGIITDAVYKCRVIHTSILIRTSDNFLVFGEMGKETSTPHLLQCAGGGITQDDLTDQNILDIQNNAQTELFEETGLKTDVPDYRCQPSLSYLKTGGENNFMAAIFTADISLSKPELETLFNQHNQNLKENGQTPEFNRLIFLKRNKKAVDGFLNKNTAPLAEYLEPLLRIEVV